MSKTLNIIGGGNVGTVLAKLWTRHKVFALQDVLNRSQDSARRAVEIIGAGQAVENYAALRPADIYLIATPDDQITNCCQALADAGHLSSDNIVFHCSGALRSTALQAAIDQGAAVASIHPIRSFAIPEQVVRDFTGTWCGVEGDQAALDVLSAGFSAIGAQLVTINSHAKILYHSRVLQNSPANGR